MEALLKNITEYHEHSKHYPGAYADALPFLDWDNQPNPFRSWEGCAETELPFSQKKDSPAVNLLTKAETQEVTLESLGAFLELALGLTGQKEYQGSSWWLRANPSSGNLHPTECHLLLNLDEQKGLYHFQPKHHSLDTRATGDLGGIFESAGIEKGFILGLSSIIVRESWKYGVRSFRYCQLDTGHALGCISGVASLFGWDVKLLNISTADQTKILGLDKVAWPKDEAEEAEILVYIGPKAEIKEEALGKLPEWELFGSPSKLSPENLPWQPAQEASDLTHFPENWKENFTPSEAREISVSNQFTAEEIIKKRRSGQGFDLKAEMSQEDFFQILNGLIPSENHALLSHLNHECQILIFVHQVTGLRQGCYLLSPNQHKLEGMRQKISPRFLFEPVENEFNLSLVQLELGDSRTLAEKASCNQKIAAHGCFSLGMLFPFTSIAKQPHDYRSIYWQAGVLGQILYWGAESVGLQGTGIGCYHDNQIHEYLEHETGEFQDFYHFVVGKALVDERLTNIPPYSESRNH